MEQQQLDFLDVLSIISFAITIENQNKLIGIQDVQKEVDRALEELHKHLEMQDQKIDKILEVLYDHYKETVQDD